MDKEQMAIARLQDAARLSLHRYGKPLLITYSGGKDSQVLVALAERSGIDFEVVNSHTTADAPETVYFIREQFRQMEGRGINCTIEKPRYKGKPTSMWSLIPQKMMPPTRLVRYCCAVLKENTGRDRFIATGVRWAESTRRKNSRGVMELMHKDPAKRIILMGDNDEKRQLFETCNLKSKMTVNPIVDWSDDDVWDYTHSEHLPVNPLYCEGHKRVGCIGCPMAGGGADSMSSCAGRNMRNFTLRPLKGCWKLAEPKESRATGRLAEMFSAGGWKIKTLLANLVCSMRREINENLFAEGAR